MSGANPDKNDYAWRAWLVESDEIMQAWQSARDGQLTQDEESALVRRTAATLLAATERYKRYAATTYFRQWRNDRRLFGG